MMRSKKQRFIIYPENSIKVGWDIFVSFILVYSCFVVPLQLCFADDLPYSHSAFLWLNHIIDILFAIDIIVTFNSAITNDEFSTIENHKEIAINYLKGWFWVDFLAILPLEWFLPSSDESETGTSNSNMNSVVRILRVGRLSKLIKLMKLLRVLKFLNKNKQQSLSREFMHLGLAAERLFFFILISAFSFHMISCLWLY